MIDLIILTTLIALGYFAGSRAEKKHYRSINKREEEFLYMPAVTLKNVTNQGEVAQSKLVTGSVVISVDYFKRILAGLRAIVGGRMQSYETLLDRARREAVLRMKEQVRSADMILNLRIETSSISKGRRQKSVGTIEALAYGTAIRLKK